MRNNLYYNYLNNEVTYWSGLSSIDNSKMYTMCNFRVLLTNIIR